MATWNGVVAGSELRFGQTGHSDYFRLTVNGYVHDPRKSVDVETPRNKRLLEEFRSYLPEG